MSENQQKPVTFTPIPVEYKELAWEYQQVAGIVCEEINLLHTLSQRAKTLESLQFHVNHLHDLKENIIKDKQTRSEMYSLMYALYNLPVSKDGNP